MAEKKRLDVLLVERGLESTRSRAQARIMAGDVVVGEHRKDKPGELFTTDVAIRLKDNSHPYVSRGGIKLKAAIDTWPAPISGAVCMDVGASTGGFTDVLLRAGASHVYAIDVGTAQLHESLRQDPRVTSMERTHIGRMPPGALQPPPTIAVIDVSFISLTKVIAPVLAQLDQTKDCTIYALLKPQFELEPADIGKGGIVRSEEARQRALASVLGKLLDVKLLGSDPNNFAGWLELIGQAPSPIQGSDGNIEYILAVKVHPHPSRVDKKPG